MKIIVTVSLLLCALTVPAKAQQWERLPLNDGRFSSVFPSVFDERTLLAFDVRTGIAMNPTRPRDDVSR